MLRLVSCQVSQHLRLVSVVFHPYFNSLLWHYLPDPFIDPTFQGQFQRKTRFVKDITSTKLGFEIKWKLLTLYRL